MRGRPPRAPLLQSSRLAFADPPGLPEEAGCAWSDMLSWRVCSDGEDQADLSDDPHVGQFSGRPPQSGSDGFSFACLPLRRASGLLLPYLDALAMHLLFWTSKSVLSTRRCTLMEADGAGAGQPDQVVPLDLEREILIDTIYRGV